MIGTVKSEHIGLETRRPLVSWGAIFAGWLLGNAIMLLMMNFGSAIGLSSIDVGNPEAVSKGLAVGTAVWTLFTWAVSFFISGLAAAWLAGNVDRAVGAVHGMCVWALAVAFTVLMGVTGLTVAARAGGAIAQGAMQQQNQIGSNPVLDSVTGGLAAELKEQIGQAAGPGNEGAAQQAVERIDQNTLAAVSGQLVRGDVEGAKNNLATRTNLSRQQIDGILANLQARTDEAKRQMAEAADKAANYSAAALWVIFFSGAFGLAFAALGGSSGAHRLVRSYRRFEHFEAI